MLTISGIALFVFKLPTAAAVGVFGASLYFYLSLTEEEQIMNEFLEWLDQCPYKWLRVEDSDGDVTYKFFKEDNHE